MSDDDRDGWELVKDWIAASGWPVEVISVDDERGERELDQLEITTRSPLGAIVRNCAGLSVDHNWLRILGAGGSDRLQDGVNQWYERTGALIVAHDAGGGFFSWEQREGVFYHAPDSLQVESLDGRGYSNWLEAMLTGNLDAFYEDARWPGWEQETERLTGDRGWLQTPPRFTKEGKDPEGDVHRGEVPMTELWDLFHKAS